MLQRSQSDGGLGSILATHLGTNSGIGNNLSTNVGGIRDFDRRDPNNYRSKDKSTGGGIDNTNIKRPFLKFSETRNINSQLPHTQHTIPIPVPVPPSEPYVPRQYGQRNENDFFSKNQYQTNATPLPGTNFLDSGNSGILGVRPMGYGPSSVPPLGTSGFGPFGGGVNPIINRNYDNNNNNNNNNSDNNNNDNNNNDNNNNNNTNDNNNNSNKNNNNNNNSNNNNFHMNSNNNYNMNKGGLGIGTNERIKEEKQNDVVNNENTRESKEKNNRNDNVTDKDKEKDKDKEGSLQNVLFNDKNKEPTPLGSISMGLLGSKPPVPQLLIRVMKEEGNNNIDNIVSVNKIPVNSVPLSSTISSFSSSSLFSLQGGN